MHLLKRLISQLFCICTRLLARAKSNSLRDHAEQNAACARDLGVTITRIRLPSGAEIVLLERIQDPDQEQPAEPLDHKS